MHLSALGRYSPKHTLVTLYTTQLSTPPLHYKISFSQFHFRSHPFYSVFHSTITTSPIILTFSPLQRLTGAGVSHYLGAYCTSDPARMRRVMRQHEFSAQD